MGNRREGMTGGVRLAMMLDGLLVVGLLTTSCAEERPKPMAQPSSDQVKGNADRAFDRLKQEEGEHKPSGM
ncbi:MAG: hypothetical protein NBKEAIPA_03579 [Nitrospirae bacterium]|nr:MAG: hypothetical protein UZ03_NOB001001396 [Nitrospira sp. OLB3]MBV6471645.1 hypothetical protein [Nitrospirota bacterium]MCE7966947.1 hypothetical protein [Nitrospira sp. NTP2]RIK57529.1 MAG: hypothetical protein DCC63_13675 [Nitrospira sp.]